jgi:hypothetical protein
MHHPQNPKMSIQHPEYRLTLGVYNPVSLRCNTPLKVSHHHLTPIHDVYEVLRCLEHEKSFKTLIYDNCSNCLSVGLKVLKYNFLNTCTYTDNLLYALKIALGLQCSDNRAVESCPCEGFFVCIPLVHRILLAVASRIP